MSKGVFGTVTTSSRIIVDDGCIRFGRWLSVSFHRTLRVPDDGGSYPLPPTFGRFTLYRCADYRSLIPKAWVRSNSFFVPLYQREALWLGFGGEPWHPTALAIGVDSVNVISGEPWKAPLSDAPQNYVVVPDQPWLDGIRTHAGMVRQFVAMPLGKGSTLAEQVQRRGAAHGIQLRAHEAKPGRFPDRAPPIRTDLAEAQVQVMRSRRTGPGMGIGAGGNIVQKVYPDPYGLDCWNSDEMARAQIYIVNNSQFFSITGRSPPPPVISAADYTRIGLPWFRLWDADNADVGSTPVLESIKSIGAIDASRDPKNRDQSVRVPDDQIKSIPASRFANPVSKRRKL